MPLQRVLWIENNQEPVWQGDCPHVGWEYAWGTAEYQSRWPSSNIYWVLTVCKALGIQRGIVMALPLRSSQSSWRNRTYIHHRSVTTTGGLNKRQVNSTVIQRRGKQGAAKGYSGSGHKGSAPGTGNSTESRAQGGRTLGGSRDGDWLIVVQAEVSCRVFAHKMGIG